MRIMTFNTQHCLGYIKQKIDFQLMADVMKKFNPDIVGLNEMRGKGVDKEYEDQTGILASLTGFEHYCFAKAIDVNGENPYGNAFLSRYPILNVENIMIPDPEVKGEGYYETRCIIKAELEGGVTVLVTHFGLNPDEQKNAVDTVTVNLKKEKCILMGDFNVTPDDAVLIPVRECMKDTADCFDKPLLSFPSDNPEVKIDYLFVSRDIEVVFADIPEIVASDHRPYIADINI